MKIKFYNLGGIKETELELRPLTVIIGPNNSSKTYLAYSIYGLWQRARSLSKTFDSSEIQEEDDGSGSLKINDKLLDFFVRDAEATAKNFQGNSLESFFQDSRRKIFSKTSFELIISRSEVEDAIHKIIGEDSCCVTAQTLLNISREKNDLLLPIQPRDEEISINTNEENLVNSKRIFFSPAAFIQLVKINIFAKPFSFPAERNAFINTYKMLANRRYKLLKENQRLLLTLSSSQRQIDLLREQGDIRYPEPVEDFLDFLTDIELQETTVNNSHSNNEFHALAALIEKELQNNNKTNLKPTKFGGKEIKVAVKKGMEIDLYNASSSIKQLAPLLLYLRFRASQGDFLVIDEPEMNLHPESQAKLLEALCILVNLGVRVLLTTHSPYIMAHLNNLVNGNNQNHQILKRQSSSLYLQDDRAFLSMDQVSAYEMKKNKLLSLKDPDYGIRWDTLSDVSRDLQQKFFEIYEAGEKNYDETDE
jgi:predicted ATPase